MSESSAQEVLKRSLDIDPPTLLRTLAVAALDRLYATSTESSKVASRESTAHGLLFLLSQSDRPELAVELILSTVLDRPDASSWHRQLLKRTFIRDLSAQQAQKLALSFASVVRARLDKTSSLGKLHPESDKPASSPKPVIKVTIVKFLAQFLDNADLFQLTSRSICFHSSSKAGLT